MTTYGLNSPNDLYLEAKNQNMSRCGGCIYSITLSDDIACLLVDIRRW